MYGTRETVAKELQLRTDAILEQTKSILIAEEKKFLEWYESQVNESVGVAFKPVFKIENLAWLNCNVEENSQGKAGRVQYEKQNIAIEVTKERIVVLGRNRTIAEYIFETTLADEVHPIMRGESENSGGGCMIDFIHLANGLVIAISDEAIVLYDDQEKCYDGEDSEIWATWLSA